LPTFAALLKTSVADIICRYITIMLMFGVFFAQTFSNVIIMADYYINTKVFAQNCENKDKPWMHCNGKCQVRKKIQQEDRKDQENPERKAENKNELVLSSKSFFANAASLAQIAFNTKNITPLSIGNSIDRHFDIFHPPQA